MFFSVRTLSVFAFIAATFATPALANSNQTTSQTQSKYPDKGQITKIFNFLGDGNYTAFLSYVAPEVSWTIMGTHPLAGQYPTRTLFTTDALERLGNTFVVGQEASPKLVRVIGGGEEEWSVQQLHALGKCKNGLVFDNTYAWVTRWNTDGIIVEADAYLDSTLIQQAITENESIEHKYTDLRNTSMIGPVGLNCKAE
ncbi:hypothetical protein NA57DRAFT_61852 [Rhizodiscina lignyota]|uniref:SnoaL-like domain-containing protein n=1 Tax=Rhizodiscina lignyota TaxID=1504668 RepID=A0A9P4I4W0_9PEZI|nr:hypothetical protein NA57DRAFT_61852 [Rhizodiscina lignyota]